MSAQGEHRIRGSAVVAVVLVCALFAGMLLIFASNNGSGAHSAHAIAGSTNGPAYTEPSAIASTTFDPARAIAVDGCFIDTTTCDEGYVGASATRENRLKLQVACEQMSYNYDLPTDGTPIIVPMNMGDGAYDIRILENVEGSQYVAIASAQAAVELQNEFEPYLHPNVFCGFTEGSASVRKARELAADADNEGDVVRAVYCWLIDTIGYDEQKAKRLTGTSGYVPDPDETLASEKGICFDYASLAAAMFRSLGIPCQIVTGNVAPENVYHAWNMIYIDGRWQSVLISVDPDQWTRIDATFAATTGAAVGEDEGLVYTERYRY